MNEWKDGHMGRWMEWMDKCGLGQIGGQMGK